MKQTFAIYRQGMTPDCPIEGVRAIIVGMVPRVTRLLDWNGDLPDVGEYMETQTGALYVVIAVKLNTRPEPKSLARLDMLRLEPGDVEEGRKRHQFRWIGNRRRRKS